jgi:hypothetical protein
MMRNELLLKEFKLEEFHEPEQKIEGAKSQHQNIFICTKKDDGSTYILKPFKSGDKPQYEVVCQEILRLLIPSQPAYNIVCDDQGELKGVLSKFIQGTQLLDGSGSEELKVGECNNLGKIQAGCLFVGDVDLRLANLIKEDGNLYKFDGDWAFADLRDPKQFKNNIVAGHFFKLPFTHDAENTFNPYNWVGHKYKGTLNPDHTLPYLTEIKKDKHFQTEVNQTILRVILLSDEIIKLIVDKHVTRFSEDKKHSTKIQKHSIESINIKDEKTKKILTDYLIKKRNVFLSIALKNENFIDYFLQFGGGEAKKFSAEINEFKIGEMNVLADRLQDIPDRFRDISEKIIEMAPHEEKIKTEIRRLINLTSNNDGYALPEDAKKELRDTVFDEKVSLEIRLKEIEKIFKITLASEVRDNRFPKVQSLLTALDRIKKIKESGFDVKVSGEIKQSISNVSGLQELGYFNTFLRKTSLKTSKTESILSDLDKDLEKNISRMKK